MRDHYELRLYDTPLLSFAFSDAVGGYSVTITGVSEARKLLPFDMERTGEGVLKWLHRRTIPKNRAYVHNILNTMGLSLRDVKGIIDVCKGLSLNDSYWVVPVGFDGKYAEYNLYENRFSEVLALTALTGESLSEEKARMIRTSPEFTTNGMLPKAWRYRNGRIILFKGGVWRQYASTSDPLEPYSEYYAAQIADAMGLKPVKYGLSRWKGILGCTCELFTNIDTAYIPMASVVNRHFGDAAPAQYCWQPPKTPAHPRAVFFPPAVVGRTRTIPMGIDGTCRLARRKKSSPEVAHGFSEATYSICGDWLKTFDHEHGTSLFDYFASTLVFDSLILNEDRHLGNFGVLRDNHNGEIVGNAPIFDNGISLFNYSSIQELRKLDAHRQAYANYFKQSFDAQARAFGGDLQREQLSRLSNFKFKRHNRYNWDAERTEIIQGYIRRRAEQLIEII